VRFESPKSETGTLYGTKRRKMQKAVVTNEDILAALAALAARLAVALPFCSHPLAPDATHKVPSVSCALGTWNIRRTPGPGA